MVAINIYESGFSAQCIIAIGVAGHEGCRGVLSAGRPHVTLVVLISRICHPMSLDIPISLAPTTMPYIHFAQLIEYYCSMGILKIWSRLAKAVHCIHPVELFIRDPLHLSLNGISY